MPLPSEIADYHWLTSAEARFWLERAASEMKSASLVTLSARLRRDLSSARTHLVLQQVALRVRAAEKFSLAGKMFFAPIALEQATDEAISRYKALRFPPDGDVADLCCGIGGDAIGLALRCQRVRAVDRQAPLAHLAEVNVRLYLAAEGLPADRISAEVDDVAEVDILPAAWHADPDRRPAGKRTTAVAAHDPSPETLERWLARQPAGAIKLAPAARLPEGWWERAECEWISHRGECRQLVAWFGPLARRPGMKVATILFRGREPRHLVGRSDLPPPTADGIARYVFEPDAAVLAARLTGALANEFGLQALSSRGGYLTGDQPIIDAALTGFEVLDVLPFQLRRLKAYCRQHKIGQVEVKKRGASCDPLLLQRQLVGEGEATASLLLCQYEGRTVAIAARRIHRIRQSVESQSSSI